jgi:hypothetical protein
MSRRQSGSVAIPRPVSGTLLGFDARVVGPVADAQWSSERRWTYLLRDVTRPLSVDPLVWPTVFVPAGPLQNRQSWSIGWIPRPDWIGPNEAWESLEEMERTLSSAPPAPPGSAWWKIAISWHAKDGLRAGPHGPYVEEPTRPAVRGDSWELLGYDVADPTISGLSNCGYEPWELEKLRPRWAERLNKHHLLIHLDDAYAYLELTRERVREHAPFFVLGLWRIP